MENQSTLNAVFSISEPLKSEIIKISLEIKEKYGSTWWLDNKQYYLHLPLYLFACNKSSVPKAIEAGEKFAAKLEPIEVKVEDLFKSHGGLIMIKFSLPEKLYQYHIESLEIFNPIRNGCLRDKMKNKEFLEKLSDTERKNIDDYGHIWIKDKYSPHVTIARIEDESIANEIIDKYKFKFIGKKALIERFQIHEAFYGVDDRVELALDVKIGGK
ncbi:hypothetical protein JW887_03025 [Candidatus Dojkabacteria bacterium]|nr:hypothetical protein [Candidatus Dojkabacteria bacterium]